ncbi:hypothetical protein Dimus_002406 [Dionaea muscipula]
MASKKMKRKEFADWDDVSDEFSDFSLSSPARKMRRLDTGLPPIIEEEEADIALSFGDKLSGQGQFTSMPVVEELPTNEERAIVLFNPASSSQVLRPANFSINPTFISNLKHQAIWKHRSRPIIIELDEEEEEEGTNKMEDSNECLAVIPWYPSQSLIQKTADEASNRELSDSMEAEETEATAMEIEDNDSSGTGAAGQAGEYGSLVSGHESLQQQHHLWQQQHCMIPQPLQNTPSPIIWYR